MGEGFPGEGVVKVERREMPCPLCKRITNAMLPWVGRADDAVEARLPSEAAEAARGAGGARGRGEQRRWQEQQQQQQGGEEAAAEAMQQDEEGEEEAGAEAMERDEDGEAGDAADAAFEDAPAPGAAGAAAAAGSGAGEGGREGVRHYARYVDEFMGAAPDGGDGEWFDARGSGSGSGSGSESGSGGGSESMDRDGGDSGSGEGGEDDDEEGSDLFGGGRPRSSEAAAARAARPRVGAHWPVLRRLMRQAGDELEWFCLEAARLVDAVVRGGRGVSCLVGPGAQSWL